MWLKRTSDQPARGLEQLGRLESELMERLWARGELSVRDLYTELAPRLAYTTVMTTLDRLFKKGLLSRRAVGRAFFYSPKMGQQQYKQQLARHLLGMAFAEKGDPAIVLSSLVDYVSDSDRKLLDDLDELIRAKKRSLRKRGH